MEPRLGCTPDVVVLIEISSLIVVPLFEFYMFQTVCFLISNGVLLISMSLSNGFDLIFKRFRYHFQTGSPLLSNGVLLISMSLSNGFSLAFGVTGFFAGYGGSDGYPGGSGVISSPATTLFML